MTTPPVPPAFIELQRFTKDALPLGPWETFRKKTTTEMVRITGAFAVETREGTLVCQDGWVALDSAGYPSPIAADEQAAVYEPAIGIPEGEV